MITLIKTMILMGLVTLQSFSATNEIASDQIGLLRAAEVRSAIEQIRPLSNISGGTLRDAAALDLNKAFQDRKYALGHVDDRAIRPGLYRVRYMEWEAEGRSHEEEIRVNLVLGEGEAETAMAGLYEVMGNTSMVISPDLWRVLDNGPGDLCFVNPRLIKGEGITVRVEKAVWFHRDNLAVGLYCSGDKDLLPIARAVDQAILSCRPKTK